MPTAESKSVPSKRRRPGALFIGLALLVGCLLAAALIEGGGQLYAYLHPSYWGVFFKPDRVVGWTLVPGLTWNSTGTHWYQREFKVSIRVNSRGYRDLERELEKPEGVRRVALLGDSYIEAIQVPFHQTGGHVLEAKLNAWASDEGGRGRVRYEVLNFGISNHGIGQYLLTWDARASKYSPDYVFILVAALHMNRTVNPKHNRLRVRPTFRMRQGKLIPVPPQDFDRYVKRRKRTIRTALGGELIGKVKPRFFIGSLLWELRGAPGAPWAKPKNPGAYRVRKKVFDHNLRIIEALGSSVRRQGARLAVLDAFVYMNGLFEEESSRLKDFCAEKEIGYVPLSRYLLEAVDAGKSVRWKYDAHWNAIGNERMAEAALRWIESQPR